MTAIPLLNHLYSCAACLEKIGIDSSYWYVNHGSHQIRWHSYCEIPKCPKPDCDKVISIKNAILTNSTHEKSYKATASDPSKSLKNAAQAKKTRRIHCCSEKNKIICKQCCPIFFALAIVITLAILLPKTV